MIEKTQVLVIGSGAGGAITAFELARAGVSVMVVEEGRRHPPAAYGLDAATAMRTLYRRRGMTPILGPVPIGYVEGQCVGGSTEINSAFWHRTAPKSAAAWKKRVDLADVDPDTMAPHFEWLEKTLSVAPFGAPLPSMSAVFRDAAHELGVPAREVPRVVRQCACERPCSSGCHSGGKQSMSRSLLPQAEAAGARILPRCRVTRLTFNGSRVVGAIGRIFRGDNPIPEPVRIEADHVIVCGGPTETPALLRRSGVTHQVGMRLQIHPMLKIAAQFPYDTDAATQPIPLLQADATIPGVTMGGAHFSAGHLALHFSENWPAMESCMADRKRMAMYHVAVRGTGNGSVFPAWFGSGTTLRYDLGTDDENALRIGASDLTELLFKAGAEAVYPAIFGLPVIKRGSRPRDEYRNVSGSAFSLTTVHAFSTCPIGERQFLTAADSYGRVWNLDNLYINDASMLPDSPGVNPQGSVMALARRNVLHFLDRLQ